MCVCVFVWEGRKELKQLYSNGGKGGRKDDGELDFNVVKKRLAADASYADGSFVSDVRKMFETARANNKESSTISQSATILSKIFEDELKVKKGGARNAKGFSLKEKRQLVERFLALPPKGLVEGWYKSLYYYYYY